MTDSMAKFLIVDNMLRSATKSDGSTDLSTCYDIYEFFDIVPISKSKYDELMYQMKNDGYIEIVYPTECSPTYRVFVTSSSADFCAKMKAKI